MSTIKYKKTQKRIELFNKEFRNIFIKSALSEIFDVLTYNHINGISKEYMDNYGILTTRDIFSSNDYISGTYKSINFEQSDLHIKEKEEVKDKDGNKRTEYKTIFYGRYMIFDFNKKI